MADRLPLAIALAGSALLALQWAHGRMLWLDEEMIAINIRDRSFAGLMGQLSLGQAAPYGWLAVQRAVLLTAGPGERALRALPAACGVATLAGAVWIGRRWMSVWGASALVFLCGFGQWISFHALELKHYSADVCFGLLLPALAVWAADPFVTGLTPYNSPTSCKGSDPLQMRRRTLVWWIAAALAQWLANGALFVAPACGLALLVISARRFGVREAVRQALPSVIWLVSFATNYLVSLGPARSSAFLQAYWTPAFPPAGAGLTGTLAWLQSQLAPLAIKPGGSGYVAGFWIAAALGFALGRRRAFELVFALVPVSAFLWTGIRLVPMSERLTLWMVPALYVGIALAWDAAVRWTLDGIRKRMVPAAAVGVAVMTGLAVLCVDVFDRGLTYVALFPSPANHELDDRSAMAWLARQARDGDVWIATWNALPAIWWYAAPDRSAILEASYTEDASVCRTGEIAAALRARGSRRALVYFGFGHNIPPEYDDEILARLSGIGTVAAYRQFGPLGHAVVVEIGTPARRPVTLASLSGHPEEPRPRRSGCVFVKPAREW